MNVEGGMNIPARIGMVGGVGGWGGVGRGGGRCVGVWGVCRGEGRIFAQQIF